MKWARRLPLKSSVLVAGIGMATTFLIIFLSVQLASASCDQDYRSDATLKVNGQQIHAQIAQTSTELERGLGGKKCIGKDQAMLFELRQPGNYSFWMKDMRFVIDIVWVNSKHHVVQVNSNVSPKTYPGSFTTAEPVNYVIEMKAGRANKLGVQTGTLINF